MNARAYDVVVIGSGAGGGTVAEGLGPLARAGYRILVVEQGARLADAEFTGRESEMADSLYEDGGGFLTADGAMTLAFGRVWGGSTVVYTGTSLIAPKRVIDGWRVPGLTHADVERRSRKFMDENGVHLLEPGLLNENNRLFVEGCQKSGYRAEQFPLNLRGCRGSSLCNLGCPNGAKQGTHRVQLPAAMKDGVEAVTRAEALRVEEGRVVVRVSARAPGEKGAPSEWAAGDYAVSAKVIVAAGGSVGTTALFLRSGFGPSLPRLGAGFTCHPAHILVAEHDRPITNDVGHPKSFYLDRAAEEGFVLETCMYFPFTTAKNLTGFGAPHATLMRAFPRLQMILVLACDKAVPRNRISVDPDGRPVVHYTFTKETVASLVRATRAAARIFFAAGARRVHAPSADPPLLAREEAGAIDARVLEKNFRTGRISVSAAHLMGGCGMGSGAADSVTDSWGRVHGRPGLFVADSSLFPDSLEINPYLSVMALADRAAERIREDAGALLGRSPERPLTKGTGAELVVRALEDEGIGLAFGIPGTHNIELWDAIASSGKMRAVLVTDEQSASFMADAAWRASGRMACVNVVPGAGLTHAMSGIAEAFMDGIPMLVLGCGIRRDTGKAFQLHDVDQLALARPVTKAQFLPARGEELYGIVRRACRIARSGTPGPVFVEVPADQYLFRHEAKIAAFDPERPAPAPAEADVARAAEILRAARRPLVYAGLGAARADLVALAEHLEAPVSTTFQGKGVFPESHHLFLWPGFGEAAPAFAREVAASCDATLAIGCRFGEVATGSYGLKVPRPVIHVDIDPTVPGRNYPADLAVTADAAAFVSSLLPRLAFRSPDPDLRESIGRGHAAVDEELARPANAGVSPHLLLRAIQARFGPETIFTSDSGNGTFLAVEGLRLEKPGRLLSPVDFSCMGYAVPAAIGAKLAMPWTPVVALAGDGAFLMTGLELLTAVHNGLGIAVFVLRDRELAQIAQFQATALGRKTSSTLADHDLEGLARALGAEAVGLSSDAAIRSTVSRAKEITDAGRPVLVDVAIDYSRKTFFTRGVVKTNFLRLPWGDRLRFAARAVARKALPGR